MIARISIDSTANILHPADNPPAHRMRYSMQLAFAYRTLRNLIIFLGESEYRHVVLFNTTELGEVTLARLLPLGARRFSDPRGEDRQSAPRAGGGIVIDGDGHDRVRVPEAQLGG